MNRTRIVAIIVVLLAASAFSCRRSEPRVKHQENPKVLNVSYAEALSNALALEDKALRQLEQHAKKFDLTFPYDNTIKMTQRRIRKLNSTLRDHYQGPDFKYLLTADAQSVEEALKLDTQALEEVRQYYEEMSKAAYKEIDPRLIDLLLTDATKSKNDIANHGGVPPDQLKEYGEKLKKRAEELQRLKK